MMRKSRCALLRLMTRYEPLLHPARAPSRNHRLRHWRNHHYPDAFLCRIGRRTIVPTCRFLLASQLSPLCARSLDMVAGVFARSTPPCYARSPIAAAARVRGAVSPFAGITPAATRQLPPLAAPTRTAGPSLHFPYRRPHYPCAHAGAPDCPSRKAAPYQTGVQECVAEAGPVFFCSRSNFFF